MYKAMLSISMFSLLTQIALNIPENSFAGYEFNGKKCEADGDCSGCEMATVAVPNGVDDFGNPVFIVTCAARGGGSAPPNQPAYKSCQESQDSESQCHMTNNGPAFSCTGITYYQNCDEVILVAGNNPECSGCDCGPEGPSSGGGESFTTNQSCT